MTFSNRLIVLDTETTGLDRHTHQPWEVAWCDITTAAAGHVPLSACPVHTLLLPHTLDAADPVSLEVGRYEDRCVGEPVPASAVRVLWARLGGDTDDRKRKPVIVGSNPGFDTAMLGGLFHRHGLDSSPWYQRSIDVSDMARFGLGWVSDSGLPLGMEPLTQRLGIDHEGAHTAAGDVAATCEVLLRLSGLLRERGVDPFPAPATP